MGFLFVHIKPIIPHQQKVHPTHPKPIKNIEASKGNNSPLSRVQCKIICFYFIIFLIESKLFNFIKFKNHACC